MANPPVTDLLDKLADLTALGIVPPNGTSNDAVAPLLNLAPETWSRIKNGGQGVSNETLGLYLRACKIGGLLWPDDLRRPRQDFRKAAQQAAKARQADHPVFRRLMDSLTNLTGDRPLAMENISVPRLLGPGETEPPRVTEFHQADKVRFRIADKSGWWLTLIVFPQVAGSPPYSLTPSRYHKKPDLLSDDRIIPDPRQGEEECFMFGEERRGIVFALMTVEAIALPWKDASLATQSISDSVATYLLGTIDGMPRPQVDVRAAGYRLLETRRPGRT